MAYAIEAVFHNTKGVNCGEFLVEANTGEVLHFSPSLYEATGYAASDTDKKNGFPVFEPMMVTICGMWMKNFTYLISMVWKANITCEILGGKC